MALAGWKESQSDKTTSIIKIAKQHGIAPQTLCNSLYGVQAHATAHENQQRLAIGEEQALLAWILRLWAWGWPARVE